MKSKFTTLELWVLKKSFCETCNETYDIKHFNNHLKTRKHSKNFELKK